MFVYKQTEGGNFSSKPDGADVLVVMLGEEWDSEVYAKVGHGEYIDNVYAMAIQLSNAGIEKTLEAVDAAIETAQPRIV